MRKIGLFAFGVTSLLIVPAALHGLTAGPKQVAKLVARGADSFELNGAKIDVAVDRSVLDPGDKVKITLQASADKPRKVTVDVLVLESMGTYNGRVPEPPVAVTRETLTLEAKAGGGAAREMAVRLPGNRKGGEMTFGRYQILVAAPRVIANLERLRVRARAEGIAPGFSPMESPSPNHEKFSTAFYALERSDQDASDTDGEVGAPGKSALIEVSTRAKDSVVVLRAPEEVAAGETFTVVATVRNPTKHVVKDLSVELTEPGGLPGDYLGLPFDGAVTIAPAKETIELAPRQSKQVEFRVTAQRAGVLGLYAQLQCGEECQYDMRFSDGALEAIDILPRKSDPAPATTTAKR